MHGLMHGRTPPMALASSQADRSNGRYRGIGISRARSDE